MCDAERLVFLIKSRPAIYNAKLKAHSDKRQVSKLWTEIAKEMHATVKECKIKYTSLRSSYSRFLREQPAPGSAPNSKRKTWYLAPAMTFLKDHMVAGRIARISSQPDSDTDDELRLCTPSPMEAFMNQAESRDNIPSSSGYTKRPRPTTDRIAEPTTEYCTPMIHRSDDGDANYIFFKSMLPDIRKLTEKNQRKLKQDFLITLNKLLEDQELIHSPTRKFSVN